MNCVFLDRFENTLDTFHITVVFDKQTQIAHREVIVYFDPRDS